MSIDGDRRRPGRCESLALSFSALVGVLAATTAAVAEPKGFRVEAAVKDVLQPLPLGAATLHGRVGERIRTVVEARITSDFARTQIYPETIEAFRKRVDDRMKPKQGYWQGEFWGKWILGAIAAQRYTGDEELKDFIRESVTDLLATQREDGYIGTYHDSGFVRCIGRRMNWNVWCRKYTLWGLIETCELLGDDAILRSACRFMDHLMSEVGPDAVPIIETGKFAGLPSTSILGPVVMLYRHTGEKRYLDYAEYIVAQWSSRPGRPPDIVNKGLTGKPVHEWFPNPKTWTKAYEFISCVEGLTQLYRLTGKRDYLRAAVNIYEAIRTHERSIFGGIGKNDKMVNASRLLQTECEPCDAVYWQRLSAQLLRLTGDPKYADEIERTMYNVLCAAMNADGTWGVRRLCLSGEHWPAPKHCNLEHHQCCVNNVPRGLLQVPTLTVMRSAKGIAMNLYIPGEVEVPLPSGGHVKLKIETDYPVSDTIGITVRPNKPTTFVLKLRIPAWCRHPEIRVDGQSSPVSPSTGYVPVSRTWQAGDRLTLRLPMAGRLTPFPDPDKSYVAVERGPIVLARDIRLGDERIHESVSPAVSPDRSVALTGVDDVPGFWMVFRAATSGGRGTEGRSSGHILLADFSSVGATWDKATSDFRVWLPLAGSRSTAKPRGTKSPG